VSALGQQIALGRELVIAPDLLDVNQGALPLTKALASVGPSTLSTIIAPISMRPTSGRITLHKRRHNSTIMISDNVFTILPSID